MIAKDDSGNAAAITSATDYYPFGMAMPNRKWGANGYRYAYQGQEVDPETGKEAFQLRLWDARIGRWLTTDPARQYASTYLGMGNNPINGTDPDGGKFYNEYDSDGKQISNLGGDKVHFYHQKNGNTKVVDNLTGLSSIIKGGESFIKGYVQRNGKTNYNDIFQEFKTGEGPEKSIIFGEKHQMNEGIIDSYQFYRAAGKMLRSKSSKKMVKGTFGPAGAMRAGLNMQEQMMGKANISMYELGDKILFVTLDSKSATSWSLNPFAKDDSNNFPRIPGILTEEGNTYQTYIFMLSKHQVKDAIEKYDIENGEF